MIEHPCNRASSGSRTIPCRSCAPFPGHALKQSGSRVCGRRADQAHCTRWLHPCRPWNQALSCQQQGSQSVQKQSSGRAAQRPCSGCDPARHDRRLAGRPATGIDSLQIPALLPGPGRTCRRFRFLRLPQRHDSSASAGPANSSRPHSTHDSRRRWSMSHAFRCSTLISRARFVTKRQTANTRLRNGSLDFSMFVPVRTGKQGRQSLHQQGMGLPFVISRGAVDRQWPQGGRRSAAARPQAT